MNVKSAFTYYHTEEGVMANVPRGGVAIATLFATAAAAFGACYGLIASAAISECSLWVSL